MENSCENCKYLKYDFDEEPCNSCKYGCTNWRSDTKNPYWNRITLIADKQREKGISTYGQGLEDNTIPDALKRIEYIQEELIDGLMYMEWLKEKLGR